MHTTALLALLAAAHAEPRARLEADASPDGRGDWRRGDRTASDKKITLTFLLKQPGIAKLEAELEAVSYPASPRYGHHLTNEQVHALSAPAPAAIVAVESFVRKATGAAPTPTTPNSDMLSVTVPIGVAESMLGAEYHTYSHASRGKAIRTAAYSLPAGLAKHVAAVAPTVQLPAPMVPSPSPLSATPNPLVNDPATLRKLYGVDAAQGVANTKQAVTAFLNQRFSPGDLKEFYGLFLNSSEFADQRMRTMGLKGDDGGKSIIGGTESMLDAEYISSLGANLTSEFWGFKGKAPDDPENEPFLKWLQLLANTSDAAAGRRTGRTSAGRAY